MITSVYYLTWLCPTHPSKPKVNEAVKNIKMYILILRYKKQILGTDGLHNRRVRKHRKDHHVRTKKIKKDKTLLQQEGLTSGSCKAF